MCNSARLNVKLTKPDYEALRLVADYEGETIAAFVRRLVRQAIRSPGSPTYYANKDPISPNVNMGVTNSHKV